MAINAKKRGRVRAYEKRKQAPQVDPKSYFEQLEPRIILGSCLALGGAEALINEAHAAESDQHISVAPPPFLEALNPQNGFSPASEIPTLFSWRPSRLAFEGDNQAGQGRTQDSRANDWLTQPSGGTNIADRLKTKSRSGLTTPKLSGGGRSRELKAATELFPRKASTATAPAAPAAQRDPEIIITPVGPSDPGPIINPPNTNTSLVLGAAGASTVKAGAEYTLFLSATGSGAGTIRDWTIDWGDGTVEDFDGNPDRVAHVYSQPGNYVIKTSATNAEKTWTGASVPVNVTANRAPEFISEPTTEAGVGRAWHYQAQAVDPDGDQVSYTLVSGPGDVIINTSTGLLSWTPTADYVGQHTVIIEAYDSEGASCRQEFILEVFAHLQNRPPEITSTPNTTATTSTPYTYQVTARDPDGDLLNFTLVDGPAGMAISAEGLITWTPTADLVGETLRVKLKVDDGHGGEAFQEFDLAVITPVNNAAPVFVSDPNTVHYVAYKNGVAVGEVSVPDLGMHLDFGQILNQIVSMRVSEQVPKVDIFLLFDDTGSFSSYAPGVISLFPQIIKELTAAFPDVDFAFGVGRFDDYAFGSHGSPFTLNQPVISTATEGFWESITAALSASRSTPNAVIDDPESLLEALYQLATGAGLDGNMNGSNMDQGPAGPLSTQGERNNSGDVPPFDSFIADPDNNILPPQGNIGGGGFRTGALPIIIAATDTGFGYQHDGSTEVHGANGVTIPMSYFTNAAGGSYRNYSPNGNGAAIQETIDALNKIGALVLGLGTSNQARHALEAMSRLTGAVNGAGQIIGNSTNKPIGEGDPYYFNVGSGSSGVGAGIISALTAAMKNTSCDIEVIASKNGVPFANLTGVISNVLPGETVSFDLSFLGDGFEHSFELQFIKAGTGVVLASIPVTIDATYTYQARAVDPDGDAVAYALAGNAHGATIDALTGLITWKPAGNGLYSFTVVATDSQGNSTEQIYDVEVGGRPLTAPAPTISGLANTRAEAGRSFATQVIAESPSGGALAYFLMGNAPNGLTINRTTGEITWTPELGGEGFYDLTVRVVSAEGVAAEMTVTLEVVTEGLNTKPIFTSQPTLDAVYHQQYRYAVKVRDAEGDPVILRLLMAPEGMVLDKATGLLLWTPGDDDLGVHRVIIQADDGRGGLNIQTFELTVGDGNQPPAFATRPPAPSWAGSTYLYAVQAVDPEGEAVTYSLDADTLAKGATVDPDTGLLVWWSLPVGQHTVSVTATDAAGHSAVQTFTLTVQVNQPARIVSEPVTLALKGRPYAYYIVTEDPNGDTVYLSLDQASVDRGLYIDAGGVLRWQSNTLGEYKVTLTAVDSAGEGMSQQFTISVVETVANTNRPPVITSSPQTAAWANYSYLYQVTATDPDPGDTRTYAFSTDKPTGLFMSSSGQLSWGYPVAGEYMVTVTVTDKLGAQAIQTFKLTVVEHQNRPPYFNTTSNTLYGHVGDKFSYRVVFIDPDLYDYGDQYTVTLDQDSQDRGMISRHASLTDIYLEWVPTTPGSFTSTFTVTDKAGGQVTHTLTLIVLDPVTYDRNLPPRITSTPSTTVHLGESYGYKITAADPNGDAVTLSLDADSLARGMTLDNGLVSWTPTAVGQYTITVTATDSKGALCSQTYILTVADPLPARNQGAYFLNIADIPRLGVVGEEVRYTLQGVDPEGGAVSFAIVYNSGVYGLQLVGNELVWNPTSARTGRANLQVVDEHGEGQIISLSFVSIAKNSGTNYYAGLYEGETLDYALNYTPPRGVITSMTLSQAALNQGMTLENGILKWTAGSAGIYAAAVTVISNDNGQNRTYTLQVQITVLALNLPPVITSRPPTRAVATEAYEYQVEAYDPEGGPLTYTFESSTPRFYDAAIDQNGLFSVAAVRYNQASSWITITVTDAQGNQSKQLFYLTVERPENNRPPQITSLPPTKVLEVGDYMTYYFTVYDPDTYFGSDPRTFSLNQEALDAGFYIGGSAASPYVQWRAPAPGSHEVILTVTDSHGASAQQAFMVHAVARAHRPFFIHSQPNPLAIVGELWGYSVSVVNESRNPINPITLTLNQEAIDQGMYLVGNALYWRPTAVGECAVTITATDSQGFTGTQSFVIRACARQYYDGNRPAKITSEPVALGSVGGTYRYAVEAYDPEGGAVFFSLDAKSRARGMYMDDNVVCWDNVAAVPGVYVVRVSAVDEFGTGETQAYRLHILDNKQYNRPPVITSTPSQIAVAGRQYSYQVTAEDADGDPLVYTLVQGPAGISIDPATGLVRFSPSQPGNHVVEIMVTDGNHILSQTFTLVVVPNVPPQITSTPSHYAYLGQEYQYLATAMDPNGDGFTWRLENPADGLAIDAASGRLTFNPTVMGLFSVTIVVRDDYGQESRQTFEILVRDSSSNTPPQIVSGMRPVIPTGHSFTHQFLAVDADGDAVSFSLASAGPAGLAVNSSGLLIWTPASDQVGRHVFTVRVTDERGAYSEIQYTLDVVSAYVNEAPTMTSAPPTLAVAGQEWVYQAKAVDPDGDTLYFMLDQAPAGLTIDPLSGVCRWKPNAAQLGEHEITLRVVDAYGSWATQTFTVKVQAANTAPRMVSTPPTVGKAGSLWVYQAIAVDGEGDSFEFYLGSGCPATMQVDPRTGLVSFTSDVPGEFAVELYVKDSHSAISGQIFTLLIMTAAVNQPPTVSSTPGFYAAPGKEYAYQVLAHDPDGDALTYSLRLAPAGMSIDAAGRLTWTPTAAQVGEYRIEIIISDGADAIMQSYLLRVMSNSAPAFSAIPNQTVTAGQAFLLDAVAKDPDKDVLTYDLIEAPAGLTVDAGGRLRWQTSTVHAGGGSLSYNVVLRATDPFGEEARVAFAITVIADTVAPEVTLTANKGPAAINDPISFLVRAKDAGGVAKISLFIDGREMAVNANGLATAVFDRAGQHTVIARAWDEAGNMGEKTLTLLIVDPSDQVPPHVEWNLSHGLVVTDTKDIVATVYDPNSDVVNWVLTLRSVDSDVEHVLANGSGRIDRRLLDTLDATLWANGPYVLTLTAVDGAGHKTWVSETIIIKSQYKLGNFNLTFQDMEVNVGGIPIIIQRTYDTFESGVKGDFGYGWTMTYIPVSFTDNTGYDLRRDPTAALYAESAWYHGAKLSVRMPDGKTAVFTVQAQGIPFVSSMYRITLVPESGVNATLTIEGNPILTMDAQGRFFVGGYTPFNPGSEASPYNLILTTPDGAKYRLNGRTGNCSRVDAPGGERLEVTGTGIRSYNAAGELVNEVMFLRDAEGRITAIIDPQGNKVTYEYSAEGDLIAVNNSKTGKVKLTYLDGPDAPAHYLKSIIDHRGVTAIDVQYDYVTGRITGLTGADGASAGVSFVQKVGPGLNAEMVTDALGRVTETVVDSNGNIIRTITHIPDTNDPTNRDKLSYYIVIEDFDAKGNSLGLARPITVTEAELRALSQNQYTYVPSDLFWESRSTFDAKGNQLTSTDAYGNTTYYSYNQNGQLLKMVDSYGRTSVKKYDKSGQLIQDVDISGTISQFVYNAQGNIISINKRTADGRDNTITFEYNNYKKFSKLTDNKGNVTQYGFDSLGRQIYASTEKRDLQDPSVIHKIVEYTEYDKAGNKTAIWREIDGEVTTRDLYSYNEDGKVSSHTDRHGLKTEYIYNINGQEIEIRRQAYDNNGDIVYLVRRMVYDIMGQLIWNQEEHMEQNPDDPQKAKASYTEYDALGRVIRTEVRQDVLIETAGDYINKFTVVKHQGELVGYSTQGYDNSGKTAWLGISNGLKEFYFYNSQGLLVHTVIDWDGDLLTTHDQFVIEKIIYDDYGREIFSLQDRDGNWSTTHDQISTEYRYDSRGNLSRIIYADGTHVSYTYNATGQKISETDQLGRTTYYEYDQERRLSAVVLPQVTHPETGDTVHVRYEYEYDLNDKQILLRDNIFQTNIQKSETIDRSSQRETFFEYDWQGNQISRTLPDGSKEYFSYDVNGLQQKHVSFEGRVAYYEYDKQDRLDRITFFSSQADFDNGIVNKSISYSYDLWGRVIKEADTQNGTILTSYDGNGNVSRLESPQGIINYEYDSFTGQISRTWTGNDRSKPITDIRNTYDKLGRLETVSTYAREGAVLSAPETARYVYDLIGNLDKIIQANGIISDYEYDQLNRLKELTHYAPDETPEDLSDNEILQRYIYDYYRDGNKSGETFVDQDGVSHTWAWIYDQLGRLIKEVHDNYDDSLDYTTEYTYDLVGNRILKQTDKGNDGTIDDKVKSAFDQNDRLLTETEIHNGQTVKRTDYTYNKTEQIAKVVTDLINSRTESKTTMEYNSQGRMSKITIEGYVNGVKSQIVTQEYAYDSTGIKIRQVEKIDANADDVIDGKSETSYLNDALNHTGYAQALEERRVENGHEVRITTYAIGLDVLSQFDSVNGYLVLLYDGHGSTRAVADISGRIKQQYSYNAYGNAHGFVAKDALTNLLYSGERFSHVSGLQYLRARWYSPQSGRFNRLDPYTGNQQLPLSFHKYAYAHMNPIMGIDPSGLYTITSLTAGLNGVARIAAMVARYASAAIGAANKLLVSLATSLVNGGWLGVLIAIGAHDFINDLCYDYDIDKKLDELVVIGAITDAQKSTLKVFPVIRKLYPTVYVHHVQAIEVLDQPRILTYLGPGKSGPNRSQLSSMVKKIRNALMGPLTGLQVDEYPYASTLEGGQNASVALVTMIDNATHGGHLGAFYRITPVAADEQFIVVLVP